jgi:hypothetical protein
MRGGTWSLLLFFMLVTSAAATTTNHPSKRDLQQVANAKKWHALLRYKKNWYGKLRSLADGEHFFLSPEGKTNPLRELQANLDYFANKKKHPKFDVLAACKFPARYQYLNAIYKFEQKTDLALECADYQKYVQALSAKSVLIVFSSYFVEKPASAFGHTLMRFSKHEQVSDVDRSQLLDYGLNYAADNNGVNPIAYSIGGIIGSFPGNFTLLPYFYKIREYNDFESRDLWSYQLKLTQSQLDFLVAHAWEMGSTYMNYFYFDENCSYHLLALIDVVDEKLNLADSLPTFIIPSDTVKVLFEQGLVSEIYYRPSLHTKLAQSYKSLNGHELELFHSYIENNYTFLTESKMSVDERAKILDVAIEHFDFNFAEGVLKEDPVITQKRMSILSERAKLPVRDIQTLEVKGENKIHKSGPHEGHPSRRVKLSHGSRESEGLSEFEYRFSLHEVMDQDFGHNRWTTIEMGKLKLQHYQDTTKFMDFTIGNVENLQPITRLFAGPSYRIKFGFERLLERECHDCLMGGFQFDFGLSYAFTSRFLGFAYLGSQTLISERFTKNDYRLSLRPEFGFYYHGEELMLKFFARSANSLTTTGESFETYGMEARYFLNRANAIALELNQLDQQDSAKIDYLFYF